MEMVFLRGPCQDVICKGHQWITSSAREAVKRGPESVKLKNLHCYKLVPGNSW
jgi:hypothetical protein